MVSSRRYVDAPTGRLLPYGLLSVAEDIADADPHLGLGVEYETTACTGGAHSSPQACVDNADYDLVTDDGFGLVGGDAFTIYALHTCRTVAGLNRAPQAAADKLSAGASRAIEEGFAQAVLLTASDLTPTPGTAVSPAAGFGILEDYAAANYAYVPTFHVNRGMASVLAKNGFIKAVGDHLETPIGSLVSAGSGYPGPSAALAAGGASVSGTDSRWLWVTGQVTVRRAPVETGAPVHGLSAPKNEHMVLASQTVVVTYECLLGAVLVDAPALAGA